MGFNYYNLRDSQPLTHKFLFWLKEKKKTTLSLVSKVEKMSKMGVF
jgi:hypothetical protein